MRKILLLLLAVAGCSPMTQREKILFTGMVAAHAADSYTTSQNIHRGGREYNPILGDRPNDGEIALFKVGAISLFYGLGELMPEHREFWYWCGVISGGTGTIFNLR